MGVTVTSPRDDARQLRRDVYNVNGKMRLPIDVFEIAERLGIRVEPTPLPQNVAGFIIKEADEETPTIYVNEEDGPQRQRFTVAHELGHYIAHREDAEIAYVDNRDELASSGTDPLERRCNAFAAELLMPEALVKRYWAEGWKFEDMRRRFDVSKAAMLNRLKHFGFI